MATLRLIAWLGLCLVLVGCKEASSTGPGPAPGPAGGAGGPSPASFSLKASIDTGSEELKGVAITPDGKKILVLNGETAQIWDIDGKKKLFEAKNPAGPNVLPAAISPDGKTAAYLSQAPYLSDAEEAVILVDIASSKENGRLTGKKKKFTASFEGLSFSSNLVVALSSTSEICGWDPSTRAEKFVWPTGEAITALSQVFDNGRKIATGGRGGTVKIWDLTTGKAAQTMAGGHDKEQVLKVAVTGDGKTLVSAALVGKLKVWDIATGKVRKELDSDLALQGSLLFLPDKQTLTYCDPSKNIVLVNIETGARREFPTGHDATSIVTPLALAVAADGNTLVTGGQKGVIKVWQMK